MKIKYYYILFLFLALVIFIGDIGGRIIYYSNILWFRYLGVSTETVRYPEITFESYLEINNYIKKIPTFEMMPASKKEAFENNAKLAEALGFLTENVYSQKDLMRRFPYGISNIKDLIADLKTRKILVPYGNFNNNYLTNEGKLIYSDNIDIARIVRQTLDYCHLHNIKHKDNFVQELALNLKNHWLEMKNSGDYGIDGLSHGKRGYSKNMLLVLSELTPISLSQKDWYNKWPNRFGGNSLIRSLIIGADTRLSKKQVIEFAEAQLHITNSSDDMAIASVVLALTFNKLFENVNMNKQEVIDYMRHEILKLTTSASLSLKSLDLGVSMANKLLNPIIVNSVISGFNYNELLTLVVYNFLYFENFVEALRFIVNTTGDNDSLLFILGGLFGAYDAKTVLPQYIEYLEAKDIKLVD